MSIKIDAKVYRNESDVYGNSDNELLESKDLEAVVGKLPFRMFDNCEIVEVSATEIKFRRKDETYVLTPGNYIVISVEIDGREWSDGCVYNHTSYDLVLKWPKM